MFAIILEDTFDPDYSYAVVFEDARVWEQLTTIAASPSASEWDIILPEGVNVDGEQFITVTIGSFQNDLAIAVSNSNIAQHVNTESSDLESLGSAVAALGVPAANVYHGLIY